MKYYESFLLYYEKIQRKLWKPCFNNLLQKMKMHERIFNLQFTKNLQKESKVLLVSKTKHGGTKSCLNY